jgi:hypothetical protein
LAARSGAVGSAIENRFDLLLTLNDYVVYNVDVGRLSPIWYSTSVMTKVFYQCESCLFIHDGGPDTVFIGSVGAGGQITNPYSITRPQILGHDARASGWRILPRVQS